MMDNNTLVSVIIPTYRNIETLERAINSVINQTYKNIEIIVVDDNHVSDFHNDTYNLVNRIIQYDKRVKYIWNGGNKERSFSRNHGVKVANGDYIMFLDNDDEFLPSKIKNQLSCISSYSREYAVCYSNYIRKFKDKIVCYCGEGLCGNFQFETLCRNVYIHPGSNLLIRKDALEKVGGFNNTLNINEDIDLLVRLQEYYNICYSSELGLIVHLHEHKDLDYIEKTNIYIKSQKKILQKMNKEKIELFYSIIGLELMKYTNIRSIRTTLSIKTKYNISYIMIAKYIIYLVHRFLTKKAFSFKP